MTAAPSTEAVWSQMSSDLRRFIRRRVSDEQLAEDLLQETFVRIFRGIASLRETDRLAAWVYRIARNTIHGHYRKGRDSVAALPDALTAGDDCGSQSGCRTGQCLDEMVRQLPAGYAEAVQWSELEGHSQQEVADRLGLSLSGAKSRIQRGRAMLKEELERCCLFHFDRRGLLMDCDPKPDRKGCGNCGCGELP